LYWLVEAKSFVVKSLLAESISSFSEKIGVIEKFRAGVIIFCIKPVEVVLSLY